MSALRHHLPRIIEEQNPGAATRWPFHGDGAYEIHLEISGSSTKAFILTAFHGIVIVRYPSISHYLIYESLIL